MNYYIIKDNNIVLFDTDRIRLENTLSFMPQYSGLTIQETDRPIEDNQFADTEEYLAKKQQEEENRINHLTMTPLDFIKVLQSLGLSLEQINGYLDSNIEIKTQLQYCSDVYCGIVKQFLPIQVGDVNITSDLIEQAFKTKNGIE